MRRSRVPITPLHFGPGLLLKAAFPHHVSFAAFACANAAIDVESLVHLLRGDWPVHREAHTLLGASLVGILAGLAPWLVGRAFSTVRERIGARPALRAEIAVKSSLLGAWLGGASHSLLDAVMHSDSRPFAPLTNANPLLGAVGLGALNLGCVAAGLLGAAWLAARRGPRGPAQFGPSGPLPSASA